MQVDSFWCRVHTVQTQDYIQGIKNRNPIASNEEPFRK